MDEQQVRGRHEAPEEVWDRVCEDYLAGISGPECCRRHGVGLTALRARAAREGWRRTDQPWAPPNRLDPDDEGLVLETRVGGDLDRIEMCQLSYVAQRRMMRAVMRGDAVEALRWRRVRLVIDAEEAEDDRLAAQMDAVHRYLHDPGPAIDPVCPTDPVDPVDPTASDGVFGDR